MLSNGPGIGQWLSEEQTDNWFVFILIFPSEQVVVHLVSKIKKKKVSKNNIFIVSLRFLSPQGLFTSWVWYCHPQASGSAAHQFDCRWVRTPIGWSWTDLSHLLHCIHDCFLAPRMGRVPSLQRKEVHRLRRGASGDRGRDRPGHRCQQRHIARSHKPAGVFSKWCVNNHSVNCAIRKFFLMKH